MSIFKSFANKKQIQKIRIGNDFLDSILGPFTKGELILLQESEYNRDHLQLVKAFIATNLSDSLKIISKDCKTLRIPKRANRVIKESSQLEIAWRYEHKDYLPYESSLDFTNTTTLDKSYFVDIENMNEAMENVDIAIFISLFSPSMKLDMNFDKFLFELKKVAKNKDIIIIATIPAFIYEYNFSLYFDYVLTFKSAFDEKMYAHYQGLIILGKGCSRINRVLESMICGYTNTKYGFQIEYVSDPPMDNVMSGCDIQNHF